MDRLACDWFGSEPINRPLSVFPTHPEEVREDDTPCVMAPVLMYGINNDANGK